MTPKVAANPLNPKKRRRKMVDEITGTIMDAIDLLKKQKPSREVSLAITKLEEALMWWKAEQRRAYGDVNG